jgi:beta-glucosidase-like glycosyl hydrolase
MFIVNWFSFTNISELGYGVPAVGPLPVISMDDGPGGVANLTGVTAFPDPLTLAATWDRDLVERWGAAMGAEERAKGVIVQLGPMLNLARSPLGGRNFEGFGEDPYLCAELAARDVRGIQSNHIVATAKHFVGNEQETNRMTVNSAHGGARREWTRLKPVMGVFPPGGRTLARTRRASAVLRKQRERRARAGAGSIRRTARAGEPALDQYAV